MENFGQNETYALACAYHIYTNDLIDLRPADDLMELLHRCCPIVYTQVGKVVSSYGGIRTPPGQALDFPIWGKAKQLTWDRAYDEEGNLCFIAYHDAGNSAYAGFLKTLLSPQERIDLFRGSENPLEEFCLGMSSNLPWACLPSLSVGLNYSTNGGTWTLSTPVSTGMKGASPDMLQRKASRSSTLAIRESENQPKQTPAIERQVQDIIRALPDGRFIAVPTSAELQPLSGVTSTEARSSDDTLFDTSQGVDIPRLVPDEVMEPNGQPEEESQVPEARPDTNVANVIKAKTWDALKLLFNGEVWVDENSTGKICILCGSPHHVFVNCKVVNPLRQHRRCVRARQEGD